MLSVSKCSNLVSSASAVQFTLVRLFGPEGEGNRSVSPLKFNLRAVAAITCLLSVFSGCIPVVEKEVVVYAAADREFAAPILDGFERANDSVQVTRQFDIESSKTLGLVNRIEGEAAKPKCDCFWNNEIMHMLRLQEKGLLVSRKWPIPDNWPKQLRAEDGSWVGFAARGRVLLINKKKLTEPSEYPSSVLELADPKWKGRCGLAFPIYGTMATHMAVLASHANEIQVDRDKYPEFSTANGQLDWEKWVQAVAQNAVPLAGNKQAALAVSRGDLDWCLTDTDDAQIEKQNGQPVVMVYPDQNVGGFGTLFIPNTLAVLKGAPHPAAANTMADYLISEKVEQRLTMTGDHFSVWPTSDSKAKDHNGAPVRWADASFEKASKRWESLLAELQKTFERK